MWLPCSIFIQYSHRIQSRTMTLSFFQETCSVDRSHMWHYLQYRFYLDNYQFPKHLKISFDFTLHILGHFKLYDQSYHLCFSCKMPRPFNVLLARRASCPSLPCFSIISNKLTTHCFATWSTTSIDTLNIQSPNVAWRHLSISNGCYISLLLH